MKNIPLVSVLMPAYNSELYIAEAIQSILKQTYQNIELIIYDDGSSDKTRQVIEGFTDPRIIKVLSDQNFGVVRARNEMIDKAKGEYIALMDADDIADPTRLEKQVISLESEECDICGSAQWVLDQASGTIKKSKDKFTDSDIRALLSVYCSLCNSSITGRAKIFKQIKYAHSMTTSEDYFLWTRMAAAGYRFMNLKERLVTYRQYQGQSSSTHLEKFKITTVEVQKKYLEMLNIPVDFYPRHLPFMQRIIFGIALLRELNQRFKAISFKANTEIYARFQYRKNGILTPLTRLERMVISAYFVAS
jgi:glycosyltransferase involved in cell wall biosynthesis